MWVLLRSVLAWNCVATPGQGLRKNARQKGQQKGPTKRPTKRWSYSNKNNFVEKSRISRKDFVEFRRILSRTFRRKKNVVESRFLVEKIHIKFRRLNFVERKISSRDFVERCVSLLSSILWSISSCYSRLVMPRPVASGEGAEKCPHPPFCARVCGHFFWGSLGGLLWRSGGPPGFEDDELDDVSEVWVFLFGVRWGLWYFNLVFNRFGNFVLYLFFRFWPHFGLRLILGAIRV